MTQLAGFSEKSPYGAAKYTRLYEKDLQVDDTGFEQALHQKRVVNEQLVGP